MMRPRVLHIGDRDRLEFAGPLKWLAIHANVLHVADVQSACTSVATNSVPFDLIVISRHRPGEHSHAALEALWASAPLTGIVSLLGSFCEGEPRTGKPWPGALRVYAHQFVARMGAQLERLAGNGAAAWSPPFTATDEDRLLAWSSPSAVRLLARVAVISEMRETVSALGDLLQSAGCTVVVGRGGVTTRHDVDLVVWDCRAGYAASEGSFARVVQQWPQTPKVVLLGFPRAEDEARALTSGAAAVVSKPFLIEDLLWQMQRCLDDSVASRTA